MTKFGDDLIASMTDALAHARGRDVPGMIERKVDVEDIDPKAVRLKLRLTQERMAQVLGTSVSGYRKWEQSQRTPSGAARTLLRVMAKEPEAVLRALNDAA
jgi:putative transcriptional regulator